MKQAFYNTNSKILIYLAVMGIREILIKFLQSLQTVFFYRLRMDKQTENHLCI